MMQQWRDLLFDAVTPFEEGVKGLEVINYRSADAGGYRPSRKRSPSQSLTLPRRGADSPTLSGLTTSISAPAVIRPASSYSG